MCNKVTPRSYQPQGGDGIPAKCWLVPKIDCRMLWFTHADRACHRHMAEAIEHMGLLGGGGGGCCMGLACHFRGGLAVWGLHALSPFRGGLCWLYGACMPSPPLQRGAVLAVWGLHALSPDKVCASLFERKSLVISVN